MSGIRLSPSPCEPIQTGIIVPIYALSKHKKGI
ncbi:hypothetical protein AvCA_31090 [Azotobacter vinelandii CA]|uniref:Uncharacterized protein n=2 Tax=Azotobacter vinelandii TaxID=354 RepID=C1DNA6_AZOVD|nr:hypothetical protein Avin_31090 [Azotobacter vinelandii DJ]AGK14751.1 hypothetical protein AvCA_31090 [Azotobacter vinelandii CA]AGK21083.1 hypothetical protein AvCA6_31090 [Azotobacter vinelandii CA6]